jgi:hypothetical protein
LPTKDGLLPLYEAVVNSVHAIEDSGLSSDEGQISISIKRAPTTFELDLEKKRKGPEPLGQITGFEVRDNGIGFTDANMRAFETLDTDHKRARGGHGVGRLLWLKAFEKVSVESCYVGSDGQLRRRTFAFNQTVGVTNQQVTEDENATKSCTVVRLDEFKERYRVATYKTVEAIARAILEHCLWYFVRDGGAPRIIVEDEEQSVDLTALYDEQMHCDAESEQIKVKSRDFDLLHIKLRASSNVAHQIAYCADGRVTHTSKLAGKVPGLFGALRDGAGEFVYCCYVSSPFFDENVRAERTAFDVPQSWGDLFSESEISWQDIEGAVCRRVHDHLRDYLSTNRERSLERVRQFVATKAPRYRPIVSRIPEDALLVDPEISDKDLELTLHRHLADIEQQLIEEGDDLLTPQEGESVRTYRARLDDYLARLEEVKKSDLVGYVSHRKVVLDLLQASLVRGPDGRYSREDVLHTFIMPMRTDSNEVRFESCNLWLIDERLAFHDYLASDKPLSKMPITGSDETKEPDLVALNVFDNPTLVSDGSSAPPASIVVVEIKRPMRDDAASGEEDNPIEQALGYLDRIRRGKVTTSAGRPIPNSEFIPGFCYVICDITATVDRRCRFAGMTRSCDGLSYFQYNDPMKAYIEVISFDGLVKAAKERNSAFFSKLGLPA